MDQIIEQMRELVSSGEWPVGHRIPAESELCQQLDVGRNTVREAVRALAYSGVLEVRRGDGTFVRATSQLSGAVRRLCTTELLQVLQVRRALEVEGARLAADSRDQAQLDELAQLLDQRAEAGRSGELDRFAEIDTRFHTRLVEAAGNDMLTELYRGISEAVLASVATAVEAERAENAGAAPAVNHDALLHAVRNGDADRAASEAGGFLDELTLSLGAGSLGAGGLTAQPAEEGRVR